MKRLRLATGRERAAPAIAFGELFNSIYGVGYPYRGEEEEIADACFVLTETYTTDDRTGVFRLFASRLRVDALKLPRLVDPIEDQAPLKHREQMRRSLCVAQALRLALFQDMFIRVVSIPAFSRANDIARRDAWNMVFTCRSRKRSPDCAAPSRRACPTLAIYR